MTFRLPWVSRFAYDALLEDRDRLRSELVTAQDRLLSAWKEGTVIPTRPAEQTPPPDPLEPVLQEYVDQFESAEGRQAAEESIRSMASHGMTVQQIWSHLENAP